MNINKSCQCDCHIFVDVDDPNLDTSKCCEVCSGKDEHRPQTIEKVQCPICEQQSLYLDEKSGYCRSCTTLHDNIKEPSNGR